MSENTIKGHIYKIGETQVISDKFKKREFIIYTKETTSTGYDIENYINLQVTQDKCTLLDKFATKQEVEVKYNIGGKLWKNKEGIEKCFNSLTAWRIDAVGVTTTVAAPAPVTTPAVDDGGGDLPFIVTILLAVGGLLPLFI